MDTSNEIDMEAWLGRKAKPDEADDEREYVLDDRAVYTVRQVAWLLAMSLGTTYDLLRSGEIPATRLGTRWIIPRARFHAWLDSCTGEQQTHGAL
ncbi:MAG: helix-turn-helix domain-containing protein [Nocardioidaceae bacterium]